MLVTRQLTLAIDIHSIFFLWKSMANCQLSSYNILQNIIFCVQQNKETHAGLSNNLGLIK